MLDDSVLSPIEVEIVTLAMTMPQSLSVREALTSSWVDRVLVFGHTASNAVFQRVQSGVVVAIQSEPPSIHLVSVNFADLLAKDTMIYIKLAEMKGGLFDSVFNVVDVAPYSGTFTWFRYVLGDANPCEIIYDSAIQLDDNPLSAFLERSLSFYDRCMFYFRVIEAARRNPSIVSGFGRLANLKSAWRLED